MITSTGKRDDQTGALDDETEHDNRDRDQGQFPLTRSRRSECPAARNERTTEITPTSISRAAENGREVRRPHPQSRAHTVFARDDNGAQPEGDIEDTDRRNL